jgi:NAD(P)-dependent dehydrogenase (short-subunit alcohol dehydrogenase family)
MPPRVVLTGANGVFGRHIAEGLVAAAYDVVCVCRSEAKARELVSSLRAKFPMASVRYELCDVADRLDIKRLAQRLAGTSVDILVNNAAITPEERSETNAGIEQQWACNVLGYQWMFRELEPMLEAAEHKPARVINVASFYAGGLDLADPEFKRRRYDPDSAYRASKQANRMQECRGCALSPTHRARARPPAQKLSVYLPGRASLRCVALTHSLPRRRAHGRPSTTHRGWSSSRATRVLRRRP